MMTACAAAYWATCDERRGDTSFIARVQNYCLKYAEQVEITKTNQK